MADSFDDNLATTTPTAHLNEQHCELHSDRPNNHHNEEMNLAWQFISKTNMSVFLTGKAGTGKTTFLKRLRELSPKRMAVLAPTGVAAINAHGQTIHSFFQLSLGPSVPGANRDARKTYRMSQHKKDLIRTLDLLVIDEISMVRCDLLDAVDAELRKYKDRYLPFGGVQLLLIGDLQQLPPVVKADEWELLQPYYDTPYFFGSRALAQLPYVTIALKHIYRQQDSTFINILAHVRDNDVDPSTLAALNSRYIPNFNPPKGVNWIRLTTHNRMADWHNDRQLSMLPTPMHSFTAKVEGNFAEAIYPADGCLKLKEGAQVMILKNDSAGTYYNGKIGIVKAFKGNSIIVTSPDDNVDITVDPVKWENTKFALDPETKEIKEQIDGTFEQYPLRLAWAITIHKSQGLTFDHAVLDINESFAHGQAYVALSRCRSLEGLILSAPLDAKAVITDSEVRSYIQDNLSKSGDLNSRLPQLMADYHKMLMTEMFNFGQLSRDLGYLHRVVSEHLFRQFPSYLSLIHQTVSDLESEVASVASRFIGQYESALRSGAIGLNDEGIKSRVINGCRYFSEHLEHLLLPVLDGSKLPIGNKQVAKQFNNAVAALKLSLMTKLGVLSAIAKSEFSVKNYLNAKAAALLAQSDISTPKAQAKTTKAQPKSEPKSAPKLEILQNAGAPWTKGDDDRLIRLYDEGIKISQIAHQFGRTYGAIRARLKHMGKLTN